jgi:hypothetical protein
LIEVKVVVLGSVVKVEVPTGSTVADAAREARVDDSLVCQVRGRTVQPGDRATARLQSGDTLVFTPPALKHGR